MCVCACACVFMYMYVCCVYVCVLASVRVCVRACVITWNCLDAIYVSKCSASIQIPHIQTVLTKHIEVADLGHKHVTVY